MEDLKEVELEDVKEVEVGEVEEEKNNLGGRSSVSILSQYQSVSSVSKIYRIRDPPCAKYNPLQNPPFSKLSTFHQHYFCPYYAISKQHATNITALH